MIKAGTRRIGIYGRSGSGKSTLAKQLIKPIKRLIVYDPMREYQDNGCKIAKTRLETLKLAKQATFKITYQPATDCDHKSELKSLIDMIFTIQRPYEEGREYPQITLLIEEMSLSIPNIQNNSMLNSVQNMANLGRHFGINLIGISQRPANVNTTFRACFNDIYFFALAEFNDVVMASNYLGKENANDLLTIPNHTAYHFKDGNVLKHINKL